VVRVRGAGGGRVSIAGVPCYRPGDRPHLFYQLRVYRRRKSDPKGFGGSDYRDLIIATHRSLAAPLVWCWDNLNIHLAPELADFAAGHKDWLRVCQMNGLVRIVKRKLKKIQYRPHLIDGCLAATGLIIEPW
jgi:hypothetical protein